MIEQKNKKTQKRKVIILYEDTLKQFEFYLDPQNNHKIESELKKAKKIKVVQLHD